MKTLKITFLLIISVCIIACNNTGTGNSSVTNPTDSDKTENSGIYSVEFTVEPPTIVSGQKVNFKFRVKNPKGETFSDLELDHEKLMHLYIVSEDLSQFFHQHPTKNADGVFEDSFTFPNAGKYKLFLDLKPKNSKKFVESYDLMVSGEVRKNVEIIPDSKFEKTLEGLRVTMKHENEIVANKDLMLTFQVFDSTNNKPVTDLEDYLGAKAHFVVISKDLQDFVHIHSMSKDNVKTHEHSEGEHNDMDMKQDQKLAGQDAETIISAMVNFPKSGIYKIFATFKRKDKLIVAPFIFEVKVGENEKAIDLSNVKFPQDSFKIIVSKNGFTPQEINYRAKTPLKLAFYRADEENCADGVIFKQLNITKILPLGKVVLVDIPTDKKGEFVFSCGNEDLKGKVIIQ